MRPLLGGRVYARVTNDDGEPQLRVTKGKTYNTRGGVKEETDPRWLEAVAVAAHIRSAELDQLKLAHYQRQTLVTSARLPYWQQLVAEYKPRVSGSALLIQRHLQRPSARARRTTP